jgi:SAM-dependent methyltransferase
LWSGAHRTTANWATSASLYRLGTGDDAIDTQSDDYADRLSGIQKAGWKRFVPNPYRWWLRNQDLGFVLDIGCGLGRGLKFLDGNGVGVDHNPTLIEACRSDGLTAFTAQEFLESGYAVPSRFDSMILMHVLEHLDDGQADEIFETYLPFVRSGGLVVCVTPQERGFASDPTHTVFVDDRHLVSLMKRHELAVERSRSFPLPRWFGKAFIYNEFTMRAVKS